MAQPDSSADEINRLQEETMRQLDSIAKEIDAGILTLEDGSKRAEVIIQENQLNSARVIEMRTKEEQRMKGWSRLLIGGAALALIAYFIFKSFAHFSGSAP